MWPRHRILAWERRNAAIHEAGHFVIYLGVRVFARIFPTPAEPRGPDRTWGGQTSLFSKATKGKYQMIAIAPRCRRSRLERRRPVRLRRASTSV
jgi:hypothetical protein